MPDQAPLPSLGRTCGRREQEAGAGCPGEILPQLVHVTVEGTLASRKTCAFAGARRSGVLGRSVSFVGVSSPAGGRAGDSGVSPGRRGWERRQRAQIKAYALAPSGTARIVFEDASFSRSRNPRTVVVALSTLAREPGGQLEGSARGTRVHHGAGQVRRRANRGNPEEPTTGLGRPDAARLAACRA
jgi:hypothetical protein